MLPDSIQAILPTLPHTPGVYKFKNRDGVVLYVGKAKKLAARVRSYFHKQGQQSVRVQKMLSQVADLEYIEVGSDLEALFLETNLIKELRPKYNVLMKDDKNFVYIKISQNEDFPRVEIVRKVEKDHARYFGPKTSSTRAREIVDLMRKIFPIRNCSLEMKFVAEKEMLPHEVVIIKKTIAYPCLEYHIKRCVAPCIGRCNKRAYAELTRQIIAFLEGKSDAIESNLYEVMQQAALSKKFEQAAKVRDTLMSLKNLMEKQIISQPDGKSQDVIGMYIKSPRAFFSVFQVRRGKVIGQENFVCDAYEAEDSERGYVLESFLKQYYERTPDIPEEIIVPISLDDSSLFEEWFCSLSNRRVRFLCSQRGRNRKLLSLAYDNAVSFAKQSLARWEVQQARTTGACAELAKVLGITSDLKRIECYDISHIGGDETVGSMVVFRSGVANKRDYRHFTLRTIPQGKPDDFASLREVLSRRLKYLRPDAGKNLSVRKLSKKLIPKAIEIVHSGPFIQSELDKGDFFALWREKTLVGFARLLVYNSDVAEIATLWIDPAFRGAEYGYILMTELIKRFKCKLFYVYVHDYLIEYYAAFGFLQVKKVPGLFQERVAQVCGSSTGACKLMMLKRTAFLDHMKDDSLTTVPDLIIIDGGKGQLSVISKLLSKGNFSIPVIAIAKKREEIFRLGRRDSLLLPRESYTLYLVQQIRDEAHRFALSHQHKRHSKRMLGTL